MNQQFDFSDIEPYSDKEFKENMTRLVTEPGFEHAVKYVMPDVDFQEFTKQLCEVPDNETFQREVMLPFLHMLALKTTSGLTLDNGKTYTFRSASARSQQTSFALSSR